MGIIFADLSLSLLQRPWSQFDSNFQIMFKVGMGETPEVPDSLSQEGHDFLKNCLQHDPKTRQTANELLLHNFCKVSRVFKVCFSAEIEVGLTWNFLAGWPRG